jgi:hypothetical protein
MVCSTLVLAADVPTQTAASASSKSKGSEVIPVTVTCTVTHKCFMQSCVQVVVLYVLVYYHILHCGGSPG